jgi:hypothetical protein
MKNREPWNFCETPKEKCTMNYCDDNGCQNRKRNYVEGNDLIADVSQQRELLLAYHKHLDSFNDPTIYNASESMIDDYLANNCG